VLVGDRLQRAVEEALGLALPLGHQVLGHHEQRAALGAVVARRGLGESQLLHGLAQALLVTEHPGALDDQTGEVLQLKAPPLKALALGDLAQQDAGTLDVVGVAGPEVAGVGDLEVLEQVGDVLGGLVEHLAADGQLEQLALAAVVAQLGAVLGLHGLLAALVVDLGARAQRIALAGPEAALGVVAAADQAVDLGYEAQAHLGAHRIQGGGLAHRVGDGALDGRREAGGQGQRAVLGGCRQGAPVA
jgi:hypothetical protein